MSFFAPLSPKLSTVNQLKHLGFGFHASMQRIQLKNMVCSVFGDELEAIKSVRTEDPVAVIAFWQEVTP